MSLRKYMKILNENNPMDEFPGTSPQINIGDSGKIDLNTMKIIIENGILNRMKRQLKNYSNLKNFRFVKWVDNDVVGWWRNDLKAGLPYDDDSHYGTEVLLGVQILTNDTSYNTHIYNMSKRSDIVNYLNRSKQPDYNPDTDDSSALDLLEKLTMFDDIQIPFRIAFYIHRNDTDKYEVLFEIKQRVSSDGFDNFLEKLDNDYEFELTNWQSSSGANPNSNLLGDFDDLGPSDYSPPDDEFQSEIDRILKLADQRKTKPKPTDDINVDINTDDDFELPEPKKPPRKFS